MRFPWRVAFLLLFPVLASAQTSVPAAGIPVELADARAARISDLRYNLQLNVPRDVKTPLEGSNRISFEYSVEPGAAVGSQLQVFGEQYSARNLPRTAFRESHAGQAA